MKAKPVNLQFVYHGQPIGKPRMTRRDKWAKRPCVLRYWAFADGIRAAAGVTTPVTLTRPARLLIIAYFQHKTLNFLPHDQTPDIDNITKAVADALVANDQKIYDSQTRKFWTADASYLYVWLEEMCYG